MYREDKEAALAVATPRCLVRRLLLCAPSSVHCSKRRCQTTRTDVTNGGRGEDGAENSSTKMLL